MPNPRLGVYIVIMVLLATLAEAGSAVVEGCADYAIARGSGPGYDVNWMSGTIYYLIEYNNYRCTGINVSDKYAWFFANNYASRLVAWQCTSVGIPTTLLAAGSDPWRMLRHGFFGPFVANYDYRGNFQYLGFCRSDNVVYSYFIRAMLVWP